MLFKTHDMESAIRDLHGYFHRVLVRNAFTLLFPVRLRTKTMSDIEPYIARTTGSQEQIKRWREHGGTLISCDPQFVSDTHNAEMRCEAPFSMAEISGMDIPVVVYAPPSWRGHHEAMILVSPSPQQCRELVKIVSNSRMSETNAAICDRLGFSTDGVTAVTDEDLAQQMGVSKFEMMSVRRACLKGIRSTAFMVTPIVPNFAPDDKHLLPTYEGICQLPELDGVRLAFNAELRHAATGWRKMLRKLKSAGAISVRDRVTFYALEDFKPDFSRIEADHAKAVADLAEVEKAVDDAPEFSLARLQEYLQALPVQLRYSTVHAPRAAGARARDITD